MTTPIDLDQIFAASRSALCILLGPEHRWQKVNAAFQERFFPGIDLIGRTVREVMPTNDRQGFGALLDQVWITGQQQVGSNVLLQRVDGARLYLDFNYAPIHDASGAVSGIFVEAHDVTEHVRTREALRASKARYRTLFENFPNGSVFLFDSELRYVVASGSGLRASGLTPEQFEGKTLWEVFPPEVAARDEPFLRAALQGHSNQTEVPFGARTFVVHTLPVQDAQGIIGGMVMAQEITAHKRAEAQLQFLADASAILGSALDVEQTFPALVRRAVPLLGDVCRVYLVGTDGTIGAVAASSGVLGPAPHGHEPPNADYVDPAGMHPVAVAIRTAQPVIGSMHPTAAVDTEGGAAQSLAEWEQTEALLPAQHLVLPLVAREQVLGAIAFGRRDPTATYDEGEQQLAEELARRAAQTVDHAHLYRSAEEALRARDEFVAITAHELKTPLTTLLGSTELLQRRAALQQPYTLSERDQRMLTVITEQSRRLQRQIDTLLDLSQIATGGLSLQLKFMDLSALVAQVVDDVQPTLERHQVTVRGTDTPLWLQGDPFRLEQVLQNLIQNAIKYSPKGGEIALRLRREGTDVCFDVSDQGVGIPQADQGRLFERFYRARNATAAGIQGLGIGLAVVTDIVTRHSGRVVVHSVEGQGSTFTVCLPAAEPPLASPAGAGSAAR